MKGMPTGAAAPGSTWQTWCCQVLPPLVFQLPEAALWSRSQLSEPLPELIWWGISQTGCMSSVFHQDEFEFRWHIPWPNLGDFCVLIQEFLLPPPLDDVKPGSNFLRRSSRVRCYRSRVELPLLPPCSAVGKSHSWVQRSLSSWSQFGFSSKQQGESSGASLILSTGGPSNLQSADGLFFYGCSADDDAFAINAKETH